MATLILLKIIIKVKIMRIRRAVVSESINFQCDFDISNIDNPTPYDAIQFLCSKAEMSKLSEEFWHDENVTKALECVKQILPFNDNQIVLFAIISIYSVIEQKVTIEEISTRLGVTPFHIFKMEKDLESLVEQGYMTEEKSSFENTEDQFHIEKYILKSLRDGKQPKIAKNKPIENNIELIIDMVHTIDNDETSFYDIEKKLQQYYKDYPHIGLIEQLQKHDFNTMECSILFFLIGALINDDSSVRFDSLVETISCNEQQKSFEIKDYLRKKGSKLIRMKYIHFLSGGFMERARIAITNKALLQLLPEEYKTLAQSNIQADMETSPWSVIKPKDIFLKRLIYDGKTLQQISMLREILSQQRLRKIQDNLKQQGLRKGINILLYGYPGTGKTETVLQLCKESKRMVLQVNISDMKSKWFGQSEKIVNNLFEQYKTMIKSSKNTPVLLFNEADAVLSSRKNLSQNSSCGQTENAIQNILLQAFENNEGIIICTTNLTVNLDKAFNRRFLFKVEFCKPDLQTEVELVKLKLGKYLNEQECTRLATSYTLTGGALDNVLTKIVAKECLHSQTPTIDEIMEYCRQDMLGKKERQAIGFK
jgi:hypothetical protein